MLTVYSDDHALQDGKAELVDGRLVPCFEMPRRAYLVRDRVREVGLGDVIAPRSFGRTPLERVHDPDFVEFLATAWDRWTATGRDYDALPWTWPNRQLRQVRPERIDGLMGYYSFDAGTPLTVGTWRAAQASADVALTAAELLADGAHPAVFALCRPPGHHAAADLYGGYCFLNNAAIAAQYLIDGGAERVAILDVDYHHGNGTQAIFYHRPDVLFLSLHGHPREEYPFFLGWAEERGEGPGEGYNVNYPLPWGTGFADWAAMLDDACARIARYLPDVLLISLGVDTFKDDPISKFRLESEDFTTYGRSIARLGLPTLFIMEGGYAVEQIGVNAVNVLQGFEGVAAGGCASVRGRSAGRARHRRRVAAGRDDRRGRSAAVAATLRRWTRSSPGGARPRVASAPPAPAALRGAGLRRSWRQDVAVGGSRQHAPAEGCTKVRREHSSAKAMARIGRNSGDGAGATGRSMQA